MTAPARFDADHPASARQRAASDPLASTWLSANAGSGKTRVLTDRVARLLLAGVDPQTVLCLTYTKAAAAEMQIRLFRRLGRWAMMPDGELRRELTDLGLSDALPDADLRQARTLFAQAIETPGGLKIQTIHAFCAALLRRFPLEAGVSPDFRELDDRGARLLRSEVAEEMADGPLAPLVDAVAAQASGDWDRFLQEVASCRDAFGGPCPEDELRAHLRLPSEASEAWLVERVLHEAARATLRDLREACRKGKGKGDADLVAALAPHCGEGPWGMAHLEALEALFLYKSDDKAGTPKTGKIGTKPVRDAHPDLMDDVEALMVEVAQARDARLALATLARSRTLHDFASAFAGAFEMKKLQRGVLDFDDLIARARALLSDQGVARWVLWRLDGGLDHILVDEAQDTSPQQWAVIEALASEFASGEGPRPRPRTIFVVGDRKQSIYSFQGADAVAFERMRRHFESEAGRIGGELAQETLEYSFRSAETVLRVVDATFHASHEGLGERPGHKAFKAGMPGRVDLWPAIAKEKAAEEERPWHDPVDREDPADERLLLARRVADSVGDMIAHATLPVAEARGGDVTWARRRVTAGDVLILVRTRTGPLFTGLIRELKARGIEVAGADRMRLKAELAVKDVEATLRVLALPEDSLSLAASLKSPLFGWSEARLFALAHPRPEGQSLWEALERGPDCEAKRVLQDLRRHADFLRPFELASRLLLRHEGRARLLGRLGAEAEDGIDAFLHQALAYESEAVPSLTGFLEWRATAETEVKRQLDASGDRVRVMTVHGAKGLEAPIVILPDCAVTRAAPQTSPMVPMDGLQGAPRRMLWRPSKPDAPQALREAQEARLAAERRERQRLLYVAMTRAESWLIVGAAGETGGVGESWHADVEAGLREAKAAPHPFAWGEGLRAGGCWDHLPEAAASAPRAAAPEPVPDPGPAPPAEERQAPLSASDLGGASPTSAEGQGEDDPELSRAQARARGTLLHLALEHLVAAGAEATLGLLEATEEAAEAGDLPGIVAEAERLVAAPALAPLLGPAPPGVSALSEVAVAGEVPGLGRVRGVVDRLLVGEDEVRVLDFKGHRAVPSGPEGVPEPILRQMGAYAAILEDAYPGRRVVPLVLWTREGRAMELPRAHVMAALQRAAAERAGGASSP